MRVLIAAGAVVASWLAVATLAGAVLGVVPAAAQQKQAPPITQQGNTIKRIPLQRFDVPGTNYVTVIGVAEIAPNVSIGRHTHPGVESGYIIEGEATMLVDGQPPRTLKSGDSYVVPAGAVHDARTGPKGAKAIVTYVVEKDKPFAVPAPPAK